ncbi:CPBP family intramembrane metalloprotease [Natronococcus sp. JC468]|nr:CPBP family intramembrane metalloprotease [Natronococcus sp. JC468]
MSDAIVGVIIGGAIPTGTVLMSYFGGWVTVSDTEFNITTNYLREIGLAITITVSIAVVEELVFRGYILTNAIEGFDIRWLSQPGIIAAAWGASAILFAMVHPAPSLLQGLHFLGAGLLLGFAYLLSGQIGLSIGIHTGFNFVSTYVFPTTLEPSVSVFTLVVGGPTWFIGQSGLLQTALLIPAAFAVIGYVWWQSGSIKIRPEEFY